MVFRFVARLFARFRAPKPRRTTPSLMAEIAKWESMMRDYEYLEMWKFATRCRERVLDLKRKLTRLSQDAA